MPDNEERVPEAGEYIKKQLKKDTIKRIVVTVIIIIFIIILAPIVFVYGGWFFLSALQSASDSRIEKYLYKEMAAFTKEHREELTDLSLDVLDRLYYYSDRYKVPVQDIYLTICYEYDQKIHDLKPKCVIIFNKKDMRESFDAPSEDKALLERWCELMGPGQSTRYMSIGSCRDIDISDPGLTENIVSLYQHDGPGLKAVVYRIDINEYESGNLSAGTVEPYASYITPTG